MPSNEEIKGRFMIRTFTLFTLILLVSSIHSADNSGKVITLNKIDKTIVLDGIIEAEWNSADSISDFTQHQPLHGRQSSRKTVVKILSNEFSIYCLFICYDDNKNIEAQTGKLDDFTGDVVSIMIDTFNDKQTAYKLAVSASGVRSDARLLDDGRNRDYGWDGIWHAASKLYDWGYVVEMEVPYKSLLYDKEFDYWGIDFDRWIPHLKEDIYWCSYEEVQGLRVSKFGKMIFNGFKPSIMGINLEIYPVGIAKVTELDNGKYKVDPNAGLDVFYNPSQKLSLQFTANPDFAQIEADPFDFNISRYESYFNERRPFFTAGSEVFQPAGRERNSGFYRPLELFYSRRIGKKLPNGEEIPLIAGTKAFGRIDDWEYGGFAALTGEKKYSLAGVDYTEDEAYFASMRLKKQIFENSTIGFLFVGKNDKKNTNAVLDIDGAFRGQSWQLAYQFARSVKNNNGDYAFSAGLTSFSQNWITLARSRYVGDEFDITQIGFVPWRGQASLVALTGPRWYFEEGNLNSILLYTGAAFTWEKEDEYTDHAGILGFNMQFRNQFGFEINFDAGRARDLDKNYTSYNINVSSWFHPTPTFNGNVWGGYSRTYNFSREWLSFYSWFGFSLSQKIYNILSLGTEYNMWIEGNPDYELEDITYNLRPYFSLTPVNDVNIKMYIDNVYVKSTEKIEQMILGFFFGYNFSPKSWIYLAYNQVDQRLRQYNISGHITKNSMQTLARAAVIKLSYLYYL